MALPAQVRKQSEAITKLYEEINNPPAEQGTDGAEASAGAQVPEDPPATPEADSTPEPEATPSASEQTPVGDQEEETFEQRWRSLQGMYNAEVPRLHAEKRELTRRIDELEKLIATMGSAPEPVQAEQTKLVTEQDIEDYGDSIDVMRRVFKEEAAALQHENQQLRTMVQQLQANVVPQVQQLSQRQAVSSEQAFWSDLQTSVPDWQDVNANQGFQSWLLEVDPLTGMSRQTYLDDAQRNLDSRRVAAFFNAWKQQAGVAPAQTARTQQSAELERQVAPGRGRAAAAPTASEPRTYSQADIKQFFADVHRGKYKGREDERGRIERDIFAAQREGRIVNA